MKKIILYTIPFIFSMFAGDAQISISTTNAIPDPNAVLDIQSSTKGLLPPRLTDAAIKAIQNPAAGMVAFNTDLQCLMIYQGFTWECVSAASAHPMESVTSTIAYASGTGTSEIVDIKALPNGEYCVIGRFTGNLTIGAFTLINPSNSIRYAFAARYSAAGVPQWAVSFSTTIEILPTALELDATGNLYICGSFKGTATLYDVNGQVAQILGATSAGSTDMFLVKMTPAGTYRWRKTEQTFTGGFSVVANGLCLSNNRVIVIGSFANAVIFGEGSIYQVVNSAGSTDVFVVSYDTADATFDWVERKGGTGTEQGIDIAAGLGSIFITGTFNTTIDIGINTLSSAGGQDIFLAQMVIGNRNWSKSSRIGGTGSDVPYAIAASGSQYVVSGEVSGAVTYGNITIPDGGFILLNSGSDISLVQWQSSGIGNVIPYDVAMAGSYNTQAVGTFTESLTLGNNYTLFAKTDGDIFYIANGGVTLSPRTALSVPAKGIQKAQAVATINNSRYIAGYATGICRFGNILHDFGSSNSMFIWIVTDYPF